MKVRESYAGVPTTGFDLEDSGGFQTFDNSESGKFSPLKFGIF